MPNWCKGDLKVRGTMGNIENFLRNAITVNGETEPTINVDEDSIDFNFKDNYVYFNGTRRQFAEPGSGYAYKGNCNGDNVILVLSGYYGAWSIDAKGLSKLSKEFSVDLKILGFEQGLEFMQDVEIINGEIVKDVEITFADYQWECPFPNLGG